MRKEQLLSEVPVALKQAAALEIPQEIEHKQEVLSQTGRIQQLMEEPAEELSKDEYQQLYSIYLQSPIPTLMRSRDGNIIDYNAAMAELTGYTPEEIPDMNAWMFKLYPDEKYRNQIIEISQKSQNRASEVNRNTSVIIRKDGSRRYVQFSAYNITRDGKSADFQFIQGEDITELKATEEALRLSEEKLRRMFDSVTDGITVTDLNGIIIEANIKAVKIHGFRSKKELRGKNAAELVASRDREKAKMNLKKTLAKGTVKGVEYLLLRADGSEFPGEISSIVLKDTHRNPVGFIAITRDITERKRIEEEYKETQERFSGLFNCSKDAMVFVARDAMILDVNDAFLRLTGYTKDELSGRSTLDITPVEYHEYQAKIGQRLIQTGKAVEYEKEYIRKDGSRVPISLTTFVIKGNDNRPMGSAAIVKDITKQKQAEAQLLAYQKALRSLASQLSLAEERERRRIATEVHDRISQSLAVCRMKLGALEESVSSTALVKDLEVIQEIVAHLIDETRSLTFELSSPLLYEIGLEAALEYLTEQIQEQHGILFKFEDDQQPKPLDDDIRVLLFQMVRELLINIVKHAKAYRAKLCLKRYNNKIHIIVQDNGVGFDTSTISSGKRRNGGFGLFSIRERLHNIGGNIKVESRFDRGTKVTITAPLKQI